MRCFLIFLFVCTRLFSSNTDDTCKALLAEGKLLYHLEKASWYATDFYRDHINDGKHPMGGYVSYLGKDEHVITVIIDRTDSSKVLARLTFAALATPTPAIIDVENKTATPLELDLITLRQDAIRQIQFDQSRFFYFNNDFSLNLIPLIQGESRRVFIIPGSHSNNVLYLGNDYLLTYNTKNELIKKEKLHKSVIPSYFTYDGQQVTSSVHSHVLHEYITSTDICTLLLYKEFSKWKSSEVLGREHYSILDIENETLEIITREEYDKRNAKKEK